MKAKSQNEPLCPMYSFAQCLKQFAFLFILLATAIVAQAQIKAIDSESGEPVDFASVFDNASGKVLGLTNVDGILPAGAEKCKSISIQHINYKTCDVVIAQVTDNQIKMTPCSREIKDVKVSKDPKAKIRMKVVVRTYAFTNGQVSLVTEELCNFYFKNSTTTTEPRFVTMARTSYGDANLLKSQSRFMRILSQLGGPTGLCDYNLCQKYDKLKNGVRLPTDWKREGGVTYMNEDSVNKRCEIVVDSVFANKPFKFWIFPISFSNIYTSETYSLENGTPRLYDMQNKVNMYRIIRNKTKEFVDFGVEIYVYGIDYASKEDIKSDKQTLLEEFKMPEGLEIPDMNPNIKKAMEHMTKFRHINEILGKEDAFEKDDADVDTSSDDTTEQSKAKE